MISADRLSDYARFGRRSAQLTWGMLQDRLELFSLELREEQRRFLGWLILASAALFLTAITMVVVTATVIFLVKPEWRAGAAVGFSVFYVLVTGVLVLKLRNGFRGSSKPFAETRAEFAKDYSCFFRE